MTAPSMSISTRAASQEAGNRGVAAQLRGRSLRQAARRAAPGPGDCLQLYVDDEPLFLPTARVRGYARVLDMRAGTLTRELVWSTGAGKHVRVRSCRLVSLQHRHVVAMTYEVTLLDHPAPVTICSLVVNRQDAPPSGKMPGWRARDPRLATVLPERVLNPRLTESAGHRILLGYQTANSQMTLGVGVDHVIDTACPYQAAGSATGDTGEVAVTADAVPGCRSGSPSMSTTRPPAAPRARAGRPVPPDTGPHGPRWLAASASWARWAGQREHLARFWDRADIRVQSRLNPVRVQQAIRWNLYQVAQASWRAEGSGIPAKGLTGQAYEGHYFWDTEVYVLPFLSYTQPRIARNLLRFRHSMLGRARDRAREVSQRGALFPWRTINGEEASANVQTGTAQYHINADIAYAIKRYADVRGGNPGARGRRDGRVGNCPRPNAA